MCGSFTCSKHTLILLNILHICVGVVLIKVSSLNGNQFTDLPILPSLAVCGFVLIFISIIGLYGSFKHHQVFLFFYLIILFCLFIVQFAIACSCLAVKKQQSEDFAEEDWQNISDELKREFEKDYDCNNFQCNSTLVTCSPCLPKLREMIDTNFKESGIIGVIFSFTELIGVILTIRYRNQKNLHTSAFL